MHIADGGGGGSQYSRGTQRENMAYIASTQLSDLERAQRDWERTAEQATDVADVVVRRLDQLTAPEGWTGTGAEAYRSMILHDLVQPLRDYAEVARRNAQAYQPLIEAVTSAHATAVHNNIPWDVDTKWFVSRKEVEQGLFSKIEEAVQGEDEDYEKAKANAPYEIKRGNQALVKSVPKEQWQLNETINPLTAPPSVFGRVGTAVTAEQHRFDRMMETEQLNTSVRSNVRSAAAGIDTELASFEPAPVQQPAFRGGRYKAPTPGGDTPGGPGSGPSGPGSGPGGAYPQGPGPSGPGGDGPGGGDGPQLQGPRGPEVPGPGSHTPVGSGPDAPTGPDGPVPGAPGPGTGPGAGPGGGAPGGPSLTSPPDAGPGGIGGPQGSPGAVPAAEGTSAAGVTAIGAPAPAAPAAGSLPPVTTGAPSGASGVGGLGALPMATPGGGAPGTSFSVGPGGKPLLSAGSHGSLPGSAGPGGPGGPGAAGGPGGGSSATGAAGSGAAGGPGGVAPVARRSHDGEEEQETELEGTWLEEEESVWGARSSAPPPEIR
ncbi:hypothetical protein GC722_01995 [Auraticoccus sp. F435]|uniref:Uncharacterized protein n=1 Tax=Auraticoccus cholistanensis TaxID=2656650 RepID=A0A6A9UQ58_9ACTN|nr:hypothetical protein [Auraticoccus cholistanensis]MVA74811.1 hypothetical protein [Auraticoccus cholistanensis]